MNSYVFLLCRGEDRREGGGGQKGGLVGGERLRPRCVRLRLPHQGVVGGGIFSYQIPRESGQSRAMKAEVSNGETGLSNRK